MGRIQANAEDAYDARNITVYVEGTDDKQIFSIFWMEDVDRNLGANIRISTPSEEEGAKGSGGCRTVLKWINARPSEACYGILDRDILRCEEDFELFLNSDDGSFREGVQARYPERFHVLLFHELENYLLTNAAELAKHFVPDKRPSFSAPEALERLLLEAERMVPMVATQHAYRVNGHTMPNITDWKECKTVDEVREKSAVMLQNKSIAIEHLNTQEQRLQAFDPGGPDSESRWKGINRILPGKEFIQELCRRRLLQGSLGSLRRLLAYRDPRQPPDEILQALLGFIQHAQSRARSHGTALDR